MTSRSPRDDAAFAGVGEAVDHAQQRRLAGAGAADDADHLALGNGERDVVDGGLSPKRLVRPSMRKHEVVLACGGAHAFPPAGRPADRALTLCRAEALEALDDRAVTGRVTAC